VRKIIAQKKAVARSTGFSRKKEIGLESGLFKKLANLIKDDMTDMTNAMKIDRWKDLLEAQSNDASRMAFLNELDARRPIEERELVDFFNQFLEKKVSLQEFAKTLDKRAKNDWSSFGLSGMSGAMFLNTLAKYIPGEEKPDEKLRGVLALPSDIDIAQRKLKVFVDYLENLKVKKIVGRKTINTGFAPFFVSVWWHFQDNAIWPIYYPASKLMLIEAGEYQPARKTAEDYFTFREAFLSVLKRLNIRSWDLEHACYWQVNSRKETSKDREPAGKVKKSAQDPPVSRAPLSFQPRPSVPNQIVSKEGFGNIQTQKYSVNQQLIETILAWVKSEEIAIPEIQRPFVWDSTQVRDLMDSLYKGFPVGYIIGWKNPNVRLKDGTLSKGRKILIDGQQRVIALKAAILGHQVINTEYEKVRIRIAFHPVEERFEVLNTAIQKDVAWIQDIAPIISGEERVSRVVRSYCANNPGAQEERIEDALEQLKHITKKQIGMIELDSDLDIETVTEIFIRINSKGVVLSQADFAMSKIAANESYGGAILRKCIDYFCHLAVAPEFYSHIAEVDQEFAGSEYFQKIAWLRNENDDLYDPGYSDVLRVAFTSQFNRGKLSDLVSLLSGRNFEARTFEEEIAERSFQQLKEGVLHFVNETNFNRFKMIVKSAGFVDSSLIGSQNALNFAYMVFLKLRAEGCPAGNIETFVRKWLVLSLLTGRYSGSPESMFDMDIRNISANTFDDYLRNVQAAELSDAFWTVGLVQGLNSTNSNSPGFNVYLAYQCQEGVKGLLSKDISVKDMIQHRGDIHHIFPKDYLKKNGMGKSQYNQIANFAYAQTEINVQIGNKSPQVYFGEVKDQCNGGTLKYGAIVELSELKANLLKNDIPEGIFDMTSEHYEDFLKQRRILMASRIKSYYEKL